MRWKSHNTRDLQAKNLFKFIPFGRLKDFATTGNIWFSRADQFGDKMECVRIGDLQKKPIKFNEIEERKKRFLISCWHVADNESLAFWDTYSEESTKRKNIAIRFDRIKLIQLFKDNFYNNDKFDLKAEWVHGQVKYRNLVNADFKTLNQSRVKYPSFRKEAAFKYENEYRFVIEKDIPFIFKGYEYKLGKVQDLTFDILINPLLKKEEYLVLKKSIKELGLIKKVKTSILEKWLKPDIW